MPGGLRRSEVVRLRLEDVRVTKRRVFIADGKGKRQRLIPVSGRFFAALVLMAISVMPLRPRVLGGPFRIETVMRSYRQLARAIECGDVGL